MNPWLTGIHHHLHQTPGAGRKPQQWGLPGAVRLRKPRRRGEGSESDAGHALCRGFNGIRGVALRLEVIMSHEFHGPLGEGYTAVTGILIFEHKKCYLLWVLESDATGCCLEHRWIHQQTIWQYHGLVVSNIPSGNDSYIAMEHGHWHVEFSHCTLWISIVMSTFTSG